MLLCFSNQPFYEINMYESWYHYLKYHIYSSYDHLFRSSLLLLSIPKKLLYKQQENQILKMWLVLASKKPKQNTHQDNSWSLFKKRKKNKRLSGCWELNNCWAKLKWPTGSSCFSLVTCKCYLGPEELKIMVSFLFAHYHSQPPPPPHPNFITHFAEGTSSPTPAHTSIQLSSVMVCIKLLLTEQQRSSTTLGFLEVNHPFHKLPQHSLKCFQNILTKGELLKMPRKQHWEEQGLTRRKAHGNSWPPLS